MRAGGRVVGWTGALLVRLPPWRFLVFSTFFCFSSFSTLDTFAQARPSARPPARPPDRPTARPPDLTVYLMTMGPGKAVWERFGHNAIWIHDPERGTDKAYNYGLFDLQQENFLLRFLQGRMWYWMQGFPAQSYVDLYRRANRSVWIQELEMEPDAKLALQKFLEWNEQPENRFYHYDYYRDNCSTRVRDALDQAMGGSIRDQATRVATGRTYRFHTRRLTTNDPLVYTGLLLGLGQPVDREISAWEEMFLPMALRDHLRKVTVRRDGAILPAVRSERTLFESSATPPPSGPPSWVPVYLALGLAIGAGTIALAGAARDSRAARLAFLGLSGTWALFGGIVGLVLAGLWALTDHTAAYYNENLLQLNPLALALLWFLPLSTRGPNPDRRGLIVAGVVAGTAVAGLVLKLLPEFNQVNGEIIALALPMHLGVVAGAWQLTRCPAHLTRCIPSRASA